MRRRLASSLLVLCLALVLSGRGRADFGDYSGSTDYDFSYSYDSDDSYDSGSYGGGSWYDDDDDYGSSSYYYSGGGGSYHSGYGGSSDYQMSDTASMVMGVIFLLLIAALIVWLVRRTKRRRTNRQRAVERREAMENRPRLRTIGDYRTIDPDFSARELCERAGNLYVRMQNAWTAGDISALRPFFTDAFFTQMERSLGELRKKGYTNYVERIAVLDVTPRGFHQTDGEDHILLRLRTRITDYTLADRTGKLVSGHRDREKFMTYEWDLVRPTGVLTPKADAEGVRHINCPNCGAPLDINVSARCPYCDSVLQSPGVDWAICAIHGVKQETK